MGFLDKILRRESKGRSSAADSEIIGTIDCANNVKLVVRGSDSSIPSSGSDGPRNLFIRKYQLELHFPKQADALSFVEKYQGNPSAVGTDGILYYAPISTFNTESDVGQIVKKLNSEDIKRLDGTEITFDEIWDIIRTDQKIHQEKIFSPLASNQPQILAKK